MYTTGKLAFKKKHSMPNSTMSIMLDDNEEMRNITNFSARIL